MIITKFIFNIVISVMIFAVFFGFYFLENIGISYSEEGGSAFMKIHIYSYLIVFVTGYAVLKYGINGYLSDLGGFKRTWLVSILAIGFVMVYGFSKYGLWGMGYVVDLIFTPLLLVPILFSFNEYQKGIVIKLVSYLILLNAIIAILEFVAGTSLLNVDLSSFNYFRSPALLSHPLNNALVTATLGLLLLNKTVLPAMVYFVTIIVALFAFGGRGAVAIFLLASFLLSLPFIKNALIDGVVMHRLNFALYQCGFIIAALILIYIILFTSVGERILSKLYLDGSARARLDVFMILDQLSYFEWFFGAEDSLRKNIKSIIGINTIENFFIGWIVSFGLLGAIPLLISVFLFPLKLSLSIGSKGKLSLMIFFLVSLTNNSLSTKGTVVLLVLVVFSCSLTKVGSTITNSKAVRLAVK